ncbi:MAG: hypothetical protein GC178_15785 [Flavobacteriales bacterium]|nr:hypothetical protein [Flavobacteriales bacterium]
MKHLTAFSPFPFFLFLLSASLISPFGGQGVFAQTSYTWNGGTSTDFGTSTNWTPNGVPGSGDNISVPNVTNDPVLDGDRTVNNLTLNTGGLLDLNGYTVTVNGTAVLGSGTITNGLFYKTTGGISFNGTVMDCKVDVIGSITTMNNTDFNDVTFLTTTYAGGGGGNRFADTTEITNRASSLTFNLGNAAVDTFFSQVTFNIDSTSNIVVGRGGAGHYFADNIIVNNHSGSTGYGFGIGYYSSSSTVIEGDIIVNVDSTSGSFSVSQPTTHNGNLIIGGNGYHSGLLKLQNYTQTVSGTMDLSGMDNTSTLQLGPNMVMEADIEGPSRPTTISSNCDFKGKATLPRLTSWTGALFEGVADLSSASSVSTGGNVFMDSTTISYEASSGTMNLGNATPDTFNMPVTFNIESTASIVASRGAVGNYFGGDVTVNNHSGHTGIGFTVGYYSTSTTTIDGDLILNVDSLSGPISISLGTTHNGLLRIGSEGYHSGTLTLNHYTQTGSGTIDLSGINNTASITVQSHADITADMLYHNTSRSITLNGATFRGDVDIESPSLPVTGCEFQGTTSLEKTGGANNANGGNMFRGATTITNSSSSNNYLYWGVTNPDTMLSDLTLINHTTQPLWLNYNTVGHYGGDITLDGDSLKVVRFGSATSGYKAVFDGSTDQQLSIANENLDVQFYRAEVNKGAGRLKVNSNITVSYELALTDGIVECPPQADAVITLKDGVEPTATDSSYVEGAVKKIGNDAYTFPIGRNGHYRPLGISAPGSTSDAFTAKYLNENVHAVYDTSAKEVSLSQISTNDYWTLTRDAGSSNVNVTISWDDMSCHITGLSDLLVAAWDTSGSQWVDYGNGGTTGDTISGTIVTDTVATDYLAFALATQTSFDCVPCMADAGEDKIIRASPYNGWQDN